MRKMYVITGQTATGKTSYAIDLAKKYNGELINCDSRQIYKELDIITGKDLSKTSEKFSSSRKLKQFDIGIYEFTENSIPIWLYDVVKPNMPFSPFDFQLCANDVISEIFSRNRTPIIVGGSYFYLKNLLYGTIETHVEPNEQLRSELNNKSADELQNILADLDRDLFQSLNNSEKHNPHRLIRKIEILKNKKSNNSNVSSIESILPGIEIEMIGFAFSSKEMLEKHISDRVEKRLEQGAINEVKKLLNTYSPSDPGLQTIGYTQIISFLNETISYDNMISEWITKEMQYAKRQMTFMKKDPHISWQYI